MKQIFLFLAISLIASCYSAEPEKTGLEGQSMPSFKLLLSDSTTYIDTKDIKIGKPVVLFYYDPHCPYSRAQMKEMIDEYSSLKDIQLYIITYSTLSAMKQFYTTYHLEKYPNIISGLDYKDFVSEYLKVTGVPFTAIYDKEKKLIKAFQGKIYTKQIKKSLG